MMTLQQQLTKAIVIATTAHQYQQDKGGNPYILHPIHVMGEVDTIEEKIIAVLHDVIEDSYYTDIELVDAGIDKELVKAVKVLTKQKGELYEHYINRIAESNNEHVLNVKYADLKHNCKRERLKEVTRKDLDRLIKYQSAMQTISHALWELKTTECVHEWVNTHYSKLEDNKAKSIYKCTLCMAIELREEEF